MACAISVPQGRPCALFKCARFFGFSLFALGGAGLLAGVAADAQDPLKVDAKHYKVEFEE